MSFDTQAENKAFAEKFSFGYPLLCDTDRTMGLAYGAAKEPGVGGAAARVGVIVDPGGRVVFYSGRVNAAAFPQQALDHISAS